MNEENAIHNIVNGIIVGSLEVDFFTGIALIPAVLIYEYALVHPKDLAKVNIAFFN